LSCQLVVDNTRRRRQVAVPQAAITRAIRAAAAAGPHWRVSIDGNVIHLFQGQAPMTQTTVADRMPPVRDFSL
jgi:hypothetical protein